MMMFDSNMNTTMNFHGSQNDEKRQMINNDSSKNETRRSADNSSEDTNNMFTKFAFPFKLHSILESAGASEQENIISWLPSGKAFKIHKPKEFADVIMPQYFNQTKYRSFQRQLYIYGFDRIKDKSSDDYGAYYHELFIRGASDLCLDMQRKKIKGTGLSNEERRKKASVLRATSKPANKKQSKIDINMNLQSFTNQNQASQNARTQSLYASLGLNPLSSHLQQPTTSKVNTSNDWNSASAAAVIKSALQVQEFAVRQGTMAIQNNGNNTSGNAALFSQFTEVPKSGRRCSLGFVRSAGRRGSLLHDGDEVLFGEMKFHFTTDY